MDPELQKQLFELAPLLFRQAATAPGWKLHAPDDLFPFLAELVSSIEKFNRRYAKRRVQLLKISVEEGVLDCVFNRSVPCVEKRVASARKQIREHRRILRQAFLERAKKIQSTALFGSRLLPDWRRLTPDERGTLAKILARAECCAETPEDWRLLASWYRILLRDPEASERCRSRISPVKGP